jgi:RNA polymerase sigma-70 factor (ECF subfamily)
MAQPRGDLLAAFEAGRASWPGVQMALDDFASRVEALDVASDDLSRRGPDLFLAAACAAGDPAAIRQFDTAYVCNVDRRVARFDLSADRLDDLRQKLRTKLLMGPAPGIRNYRGQAPLGAWLHVTAVRLAIDIAAVPPAHGGDIDLLQLAAPEGNPEVETAQLLHAERFRAALEDSFQALTAREKTILRLHVVDNLNIDAIGAIYAVHRATAARWLVAIRTRVYDKLKEEFALRWKASSSDIRSLARLLRDHIHITAKRVLGSGP